MADQTNSTTNSPTFDWASALNIAQNWFVDPALGVATAGLAYLPSSVTAPAQSVVLEASDTIQSAEAAAQSNISSLLGSIPSLIPSSTTIFGSAAVVIVILLLILLILGKFEAL